ncbi:YraN family protein [Bordetella avium]|uniref:YraN family protein n=2 Tax=Bordetella avium TaxID=521 RepID=UPI000E6A19B3|nr:YraN family protein [Bordetella avium]RIQ38552.1 YraN family protein [Bordetella avium]RIQ43091.1 YraN family protein [Bordetella avium]RIQ43974.1 YraN family protein [Bordetella avium]RIQ53111.1 YraN family protein [Bordetella avium]RIQ76915.1 YraN family protein [Bordetella avium]
MRRLLDFLRRGLIRPDPRHAQGKRAEAQGLRLLRAQGLRLLARNRHGELDLIMLDGEVLVVVEVRWRSGSAFGGAAASIGPAKQARLARAAACWLAGSEHAGRRLRFDVLAFEAGQARWLRGAFEPPAYIASQALRARGRRR